MSLPQDNRAVRLNQLKSASLDGWLQTLTGSSIKKISLGSNSSGSGSGGGWLDLGNLWTAVTGFLSWVGNLVVRFTFTLTSLVGIVQAQFQYLWNFNWNLSDKDIEGQIQSLWIAFYSQLGGTLGNAAGYLACGGLAGTTIFAFNEAMGVYVLKELGEEALEEFVGNAIALMHITANSLIQTAFLKAYKSNRALFTLIRNGAGQMLDAITPGSLSWQQYVRQRTVEGGVISFAEFQEESIESIKSPTERAFYEEFFEEFGEGCWESLYVVAQAFDLWMATQKTETEILLGEQKVIEVLPNREIESERLLLVGREELIKPALVETLKDYQLVENRDIGQFVGQSMQEFVLGNPLTLRVNLILYPYPEPPFNRGERKQPQEVSLVIPDVDRSKLKWLLLKEACGGKNGYTWGRYCANARLDNGRSIQCWAATEAEAEKQVQRMLRLTSAKLLTLQISEQQKVGEVLKKPRLRKDPQQMYPAFAYVVNREEFLDPNKGRQTSRQNFRDRRSRIPLYMDRAPADFDEIIQGILKKGDL